MSDTTISGISNWLLPTIWPWPADKLSSHYKNTFKSVRNSLNTNAMKGAAALTGMYLEFYRSNLRDQELQSDWANLSSRSIAALGFYVLEDKTAILKNTVALLGATLISSISTALAIVATLPRGLRLAYNWISADSNANSRKRNLRRRKAPLQSHKNSKVAKETDASKINQRTCQLPADQHGKKNEPKGHLRHA